MPLQEIKICHSLFDRQVGDVVSMQGIFVTKRIAESIISMFGKDNHGLQFDGSLLKQKARIVDELKNVGFIASIHNNGACGCGILTAGMFLFLDSLLGRNLLTAVEPVVLIDIVPKRKPGWVCWFEIVMINPRLKNVFVYGID